MRKREKETKKYQPKKKTAVFQHHTLGKRIYVVLLIWKENPCQEKERTFRQQTMSNINKFKLCKTTEHNQSLLNSIPSCHVTVMTQYHKIRALYFPPKYATTIDIFYTEVILLQQGAFISAFMNSMKKFS